MTELYYPTFSLNSSSQYNDGCSSFLGGSFMLQIIFSFYIFKSISFYRFKYIKHSKFSNKNSFNFLRNVCYQKYLRVHELSMIWQRNRTYNQKRMILATLWTVLMVFLLRKFSHLLTLDCLLEDQSLKQYFYL